MRLTAFLTALLLFMGATASAQLVYIDAFSTNHEPLGQATLGTSAPLVVSNIGSSGDDGVSVVVPPIMGFELALQDPFPGAAGTASLTVEYQIPGMMVPLATSRPSPFGMEIGADFSSMGVSTAQVRLHHSGYVVFDGAHADPTPTAFVGASDFRIVARWVGSSFEIAYEFAAPTLCTTAGGSSTLADRMVFLATPPLAGATPMGAIRIKAKDLPAFVIENERLDPTGDGFISTGPGLAYRTAASGFEFDIAPQTGSSYFSLPGAGNMNMLLWDPALETTSLPLGATLGMRGDGAGHIMQLVRTAGGFEVRAAPGEAVTWTVDVYAGGILVGSFPGLPSAAAEVCDLPDCIIWDIDTASPAERNRIRLIMSDANPGATIPDPNGSFFVPGDEIHLVPDLPIDRAPTSRVDITFDGLSSVGVEAYAILADPLTANFPGTGEGLLQFTTNEAGIPTGGPGHDRKTLLVGSLLEIRTATTNSALELAPLIIVGQVFLDGTPPASPFPGIAVEPSGVFLLGGGAGPLGPTLLPPAGHQLAFAIPAALSSWNLMIQALVATPLAANGIFASSDGTEVVVP